MAELHGHLLPPSSTYVWVSPSSNGPQYLAPRPPSSDGRPVYRSPHLNEARGPGPGDSLDGTGGTNRPIPGHNAPVFAVPVPRDPPRFLRSAHRKIAPAAGLSASAALVFHNLNNNDRAHPTRMKTRLD